MGAVAQEGEKAADPEAEFKQLNFSDCRFPSDRLTIAMMRITHPTLFDYGLDARDENQPQYFLQLSAMRRKGIGNLLVWERLVATLAHAKE
jgi:hypothetical protein